MRKKHTILLSFCLVIISLFLISYQIINKMDDKEKLKEKIKAIPDFTFYDMDSLPFAKQNIENNPTIFIYFNSTCEYCHLQIEEIKKNINLFQQINLIFISDENIKTIQDFAKTTNLSNYQNIKFLKSANYTFSKLFNSSSTPDIFIYNSRKELVKNYKEIVQVSKILKHIP